MARLFEILCVLTTLVASGYTLSCMNCYSLSSASCKGPSEICPSGHVCSAFYQIVQIGGFAIPAFQMSCAPQSECGMITSGRLLGGGIMKSAQSCCTTDNCIPAFPSEPTDSSTTNGLTCSLTRSLDVPWNSNDKIMQCKGNETMCVLMSIKILEKPLLLKGCATEGLCDNVVGILPEAFKKFVEIDCTKADSTNHWEL